MYTGVSGANRLQSPFLQSTLILLIKGQLKPMLNINHRAFGPIYASVASVELLSDAYLEDPQLS